MPLEIVLSLRGLHPALPTLSQDFPASLKPLAMWHHCELKLASVSHEVSWNFILGYVTDTIQSPRQSSSANKMSEYIANLLQEVKLLLGLSTLNEIRDLFNETTTQTLFNNTLQPLLLADQDADIPDLYDIKLALSSTLVNETVGTSTDGIPTSMDLAAAQDVESEGFRMMMAHVAERIGNSEEDSAQTLYGAWMVVKLAVAIYRYGEQNDDGDVWADHAFLDSEGEGEDGMESDSDISDEEDDGAESVKSDEECKWASQACCSEHQTCL